MSHTTDSAVRKRLRARFDRMALDQLRQEVARLHVELEETKQRLWQAEDSAEYYCDQVHTLAQAVDSDGYITHRQVGINQSGEMLVVGLEH